MSEVFDVGLQPERTLLAWRRTSLALGVAGAVAVRLTTEWLGAFAILVGAGIIGLAALAYVTAAHRYRRAHQSHSRSGALPATGSSVAVATLTLLSLVTASALFVVLR